MHFIYPETHEGPLKPQPLSHVDQIKSKLELMHSSARSHALLISGPAGFGKTQAVTDALKEAKLEAVRLGSYSTPLHLFNFMEKNCQKIVVLDDTSGLFYDKTAMAIIKDATWTAPHGRIVSWGTRTSKAVAREFNFRGKLIIICNAFPITPDAVAVRSRSFTHQFQISKVSAAQLLRAAGADRKWFKNTKISKEVAEFLCDNLTDASLPHISYRTLHTAYEAAEKMPHQWKQLMGSMIHAEKEYKDPKVVIKELARQGLKVGEQIMAFEDLTGFKRRTFFKYRKRLAKTVTTRAPRAR